ncbi:DUF4358 domain-containing protein [Romboutsia weinsteinii]|uniref:DUF4358 domain-containing protein n=1 Tax=Romboutsia weinsteinii TaxID=2020949 RepID=A0A371J317_9FIRM|nr:DUF4358 domain-containing protein [Romboutsia weinsteinii]RDY27058.1 DUF4358 domain-containing protein [Romboutsia weinsteinii]
MKKILLICSLICTFALVGCSSDSKVKDVSTNDIKEAILSEKLIDEENIDDIDAKEFYGFESVKDKIEEGFKLGAMINVRLRDVIVVKTSDPEAITKALEEYKENSLRMFADGYGGEDNIESVSNSILKTAGNYVYFIATPNASDIEASILKVIKE